MANSNNVLITAASGNIGKLLVPLLANCPESPSYTIILPTRDASRISIPSDTRANIIVAEGDTADALWLESLMTKYSIHTVLSNFSFTEELILTLNLWSAATRCGVKHLIYMSAAFDTTTQAVLNGAMSNLGAAHCAYKYIGEQKLMYGNPSFTWTILAPTLFFTNDYRSKDGLPQSGSGKLIEPLGDKGCSRVDAADIALAVKRAIDDGGKEWHGKKVYLGTLERYTTAATAELWSKALSSNIRSAQIDRASLIELEKTIAGYGGTAWARDIVQMYEQFQIEGFGLTEEQYREQVQFLGQEPSSYEDFVEKTAKAWKTKQVAKD